MAAVVWTDSIGAATLEPNTNAIGAVSRFNGWNAVPHFEGTDEVRLSDGSPMIDEYRTEYRISFVVPRIAPDKHALAQRLVLHLRRGGTATVNTTDLANRSYTCTRHKGGEAVLDGPDPVELWYSLALSLRTTATAAPECIYRAGP